MNKNFAIVLLIGLLLIQGTLWVGVKSSMQKKDVRIAELQEDLEYERDMVEATLESYYRSYSICDNIAQKTNAYKAIIRECNYRLDENGLDIVEYQINNGYDYMFCIGEGCMMKFSGEPPDDHQ
jgi:hypothetical protein